MQSYAPIENKDEVAVRKICERLSKGLDILEVGTGNSTHIFKEYGTITSVDADLERLEFFKPDIAVHTDSMNFKPSKKYDIIFVDGCHTYHTVKTELDNLYPFVKDGGYLCGHDFDGYGYDDSYIGQDTVSGKHHGVVKAVTEKFGTVELVDNTCVWCVKK